MKKKYTLIPVIAIILAVLTGLFISLFTTPVLAYITENKSSVTEIKDKQGNTLYYDYDDWFYTAKKVGKIMSFAYKVNPSLENLEVIRDIYSVENYVKGTHKGNIPPKYYLKNCVKYAKKYLDSEYVDGESPYAVPDAASFTTNLKFVFYTLQNTLEYAKALYIDGQIEESKRVMEDLISQFDKNNPDEFGYCVAFTKGYFYLVYSSTDNPTLKQWVLDKEAFLEKYGNANGKFDKFIARHGSLFTNPDYDTFVSGDWPDKDPIEDENTERISDETVSEVPTP